VTRQGVVLTDLQSLPGAVTVTVHGPARRHRGLGSVCVTVECLFVRLRVQTPCGINQRTQRALIDLFTLTNSRELIESVSLGRGTVTVTVPESRGRGGEK
jgi:peptidyl-tRNA hydrolase